MSSWAAVANKNSSVKFTNNVKKVVKKDENENKKKKLTAEDFFYDADEEFNFEHSEQIFDIEESFKEHLNINDLPFLDNTKLFAERNLYDFIMYNSKNYERTYNKVEKKNEAILKEWNEEDSSEDNDSDD